MAVALIRTAWSGTTGGPGVTQLAINEPGGTFFSSTNLQTCVNAVRTFWDATKSYLPDEIVLTTQATVDIYDISSGDLTGSITVPTAPTSVGGLSTQTYAMAAGMKVNLQTGVIRDGRRVRGSIFIVPTASNAMNANGGVSSTTRTAINTAAATMLSSINGTGLQWAVWSRKRLATEDLPERPGAVSPITVAETNEKACILRGRRD